MIDLVVMSSDLQPHVLDTRVKRGVELSINHHLLFSCYWWWGRTPLRPGTPKHIVRVCWAWKSLSKGASASTSGRASTMSQGRSGILSPSGPHSVSTSAVATSWWVSVMAAIPKSAGGHRRKGMLSSKRRSCTGFSWTVWLLRQKVGTGRPGGVQLWHLARQRPGRGNSLVRTWRTTSGWLQKGYGPQSGV